MVAPVVDARAKFGALHAKALTLGSAAEGAPGDRSGGFQAAYFRDRGGNKLDVLCVGRANPDAIARSAR
jgi:hypothetical protein